MKIPGIALALLLVGMLQAAGAAPPVPSPPPVNATGYLLLDFDSGQVLASKNTGQRMPPASLTKILTAYVVFHEIRDGRLRLTDTATVSEKAWRMPGSRMFIEIDKRVSVEDLLKGLIIQSGNDASVALAELVAGSEESFAALMNEYAKRLGMQNSQFANSTGLPDDNHYTTTADLAVLARAMIREFPEHYAWHAQKEFTYNKINQHNRNTLLWQDDSVDGIKTGHTEAAGYCLVASALRDGRRLISVVMGTKSEAARARESRKLLDYGFRFFETHRLFGAGEPMTSKKIWKGEREELPLGVESPLYITVPRGGYDRLKAGMQVDELIIAPVQAGQRYGTVKVRLDGKLLASRPLVALEDVAAGSVWQRMVDHVLLWVE